MNNRLPDSITDEKDLELFEKYLSDSKDDLSDGLIDCLKNHKGKLVRVESLIAGRLFTRCGILSQVGADFIVIRPQKSCANTIIGLTDIKYITVVSNNCRKNGLC